MTQLDTGSQIKPHRGVLILVLGILGLVVCAPLGIVAWVMGNNDLAEIAVGTMDKEGEGLTKAGKICGMIATILFAIGIIIFVISIVLGAVMAGASTAVG